MATIIEEEDLKLYNIKKKRKHLHLRFLVDLRGIEPLSESLSLKASPITVIILTFPP